MIWVTCSDTVIRDIFNNNTFSFYNYIISNGYSSDNDYIGS